jgi:hypothetical protein
MKTGNVKNVAAFEKLVGICNDLGASYDPSKAALTPTALATLLEQAQQSLQAVTIARATLILATNSRQEKFAGIYPLAARIVRALAASDSSLENIRDARLIKRKFATRTIVPIATETESSEEGSILKIRRTSSRLDYDGLADTFASLVKLVQSIPAYAPNEPDLKVDALESTLNELHAKSKAVNTAANALAKARIQRNKVLLGKKGMYEIGTAVKEYIRSVFGVRSEVSRELGKLRLAA